MRRGDIVILDHSFSDASGSMVRPALVVQSDRDNARLTNTIVALITKNTTRIQEPTQLFIDIATDEGAQTGWCQESAIVFNPLFAVAQTRILRVVGGLPPSLAPGSDRRLSQGGS